MKELKKDKFRQTVALLIAIIWLAGLALLPDGILKKEHLYNDYDIESYDSLYPIVGLMYVSPGLFAVLGVLFSLFFGEKDGIVVKMIFAFYLGITVCFLMFSVERKIFLPSAAMLVVAISLLFFLIIKNDKYKS